MKKINRTKSDIFLDIIYWIAAAITFAGVVATLYMMLQF